MIVVNGSPSELPGSATVKDAMELLGLALDARGVAVAVEGEVVPRAEWGSFRLPEGARVEVLRAMQGG